MGYLRLYTLDYVTSTLSSLTWSFEYYLLYNPIIMGAWRVYVFPGPCVRDGVPPLWRVQSGELEAERQQVGDV